MRKLKSWPVPQVQSVFKPSAFRPFLLIVLAFFSLIMPAHIMPAYGQVNIFVASSLVDVMGEMAQDFETESGISVAVVSAGSSTLAQQIVAGAPANIFVSANLEWVEFVRERASFSTGEALFSNRLVIIARPDTNIDLTSLADLTKRLQGQRLAIGDPAHVPVGIYARQALIGVDIWQQIKNSIAPTSDARSALRLVATGSAPLGIVYASDARDKSVRIVYEIDPALHGKIFYWGALSLNANTQAREFFDYLGGHKMQDVAQGYGFLAIGGGDHT